LPKALKDWFIFFASSRVSPEAPVLETFSLPKNFNVPKGIFTRQIDEI
jgi:hypothetical protein